MSDAITPVSYPNGTNGQVGREIAIHRHRHELEHEIRRLRRENTQLRNQMHENHTAVRIARRARKDALAIVADLHAGLLVSREAMEARRGISRRRWEWARAMLAAADCTNHFYRLTVQDPAEVDRRLSAVVDAIIETRLLTDLERYLPASRRRERWKW